MTGSLVIDFFIPQHDFEAGTPYDHVTLDFVRQDGSTLQIMLLLLYRKRF